MKTFRILEKPGTWLFALIIYLMMIFMVSHLSSQQIGQLPIAVWDKLVHFLEYMPVGLMVTGLLHAKWPNVAWGRTIFGAIVIVAILGGLDEFHQSFVPGRTVSAGDVVADTMGATVGALSAAALLKGLRQRLVSVSASSNLHH
ncbi:MAG: VanZ family protein [Deltaproteobacteria bacterium]|nr:VanZ family protein [Deltaproteobacteria bacterium]